MNTRLMISALAFLAWGMPSAAPAVTVSNLGELTSALNAAGPGTIIELAPGTYVGGFFHSGVAGAPGNPVTVRSADPENPAVFVGQVQFSEPSWLVLENFNIRDSAQNGLNIDDGGTFDTPAHHLVIRGITVEDVGPTGNRDGIKLSGITDFLVENCVVRRWGTGGSSIDMVGCRKGLITGCHFDWEGSPGNDGTAFTGIQAKGGCENIVVSFCTFHHAGDRALQIGGSTDPNVIRPPGAQYECRNLVAACNVFTGSPAPIAWVTCTDSVVAFSTILWPENWIMRILQEVVAFEPCGRNTFEGNIVLWREADMNPFSRINIGPNTAPETFTFKDNLWYATDNPGLNDMNLPAAETGGVYGVDPRVDPDGDDLDIKEEYLGYGHHSEAGKALAAQAALSLAPWAASQTLGFNRSRTFHLFD